jgi:hypothetical protein
MIMMCVVTLMPRVGFSEEGCCSVPECVS